MLPSNRGGDTTTISFTPATWAGTTVMITVAVMSTVEGRGAAAPGTQTPTRRIGVYRIPSPCENSERAPMKIRC